MKFSYWSRCNKHKGFSDENDFYFGFVSSNTFYAGKGADYVFVWGKDNRLYGEEGNDRLFSFGSNNEISGGSGNDRLSSYGNNNVVHGDTGHDYVRVCGSNNIIDGGAGNDYMYVYGNNNAINGGDGNDFIWARSWWTSVHVDGGAGNDRVYTGWGNDTAIYSFQGNEDASDYYSASWGVDTLVLNFEYQDIVNIVLNLETIDSVEQWVYALHTEFEKSDKSISDFSSLGFELRARNFEKIELNINGGDENNPPSDIKLSNNTVDENANSGTVVGIVSSVNDPGEEPSYILTNDANGLFSINSASGIITVNTSALDYEDNASYVITVTTDDGTGLRVDTDFTIFVKDINERPYNLMLSNNMLDENSSPGTVLGVVSSMNDDGETPTYTLTHDAFEIDSHTGVISVKDSSLLDFEKTRDFNLDVNVDDGHGLESMSTFNITLNDVNEAPWSVSLSNSHIDENSAKGMQLGIVSSMNDDGETPTYTLIHDAFEIDSHTGVISVKDSSLLDFEKTRDFNLDVNVDDGHGFESMSTFNITLNDVNEAPNTIVLDDNFILENSEVGTLVGTVSSRNDVGESPSYSLSNDAGGIFAIDESTGVVTVNRDSLDFENQESHLITVNVDDNNGFTSSEDFTILVGDINEPPTPDIDTPLMGRLWHSTTFDFAGPDVSELDALNPFTDYRMDVTFTHVATGEQVNVPGYFAADGDAANTGATSGNIWRAHFNAHLEGEWTYKVDFVTGDNIAASLTEVGESAGYFDNQVGGFTILHSDKLGDDFRAGGRLQHDASEHHLKASGNDNYFIKTGVDSPENFLAYDEFDNTKDTHSYSIHESEWRDGDPTWADGQGKSIIGSINYLAEQGVNSLYFLPMNVAGDGRDVWPWVDSSFDLTPKWSTTFVDNVDPTRYDISKLGQWDILFSHMQEKGLMLHFVTQETENDQLLDGGDLGIERAIYYRELIARFSHHNAITWNLGEENTNTDSQLTSFANYFKALDPYDHLVVAHTGTSDWSKDRVYNPQLSNENFDGASLQSSPMSKVHIDTLTWLERSAANPNGTNWVVTSDEIGGASTGVAADINNAQHNDVRYHALWGNLMAGGAGVEWYFGYSQPHNDLNLEDFSSREEMYRQSTIAREFFEKYLPFESMHNDNSITTNTSDYGLVHNTDLLVIYHADATSMKNIDLTNYNDTYSIFWFDPRHGGNLETSAITSVTGGGVANIGMAPTSSDDSGWDVVDYVTILVGSQFNDEKGVFNIGDNIVGTSANDTVNTSALNDVIKTLDGDDNIQANAGHDEIDTGNGHDIINAGSGDDRIYAGEGNDHIHAGDGDDFVDAGFGADYINGADGDDKLFANDGNDIIFGGSGVDIVDGGKGDDVIQGGAGADFLRGGMGADTFVYQAISQSSTSNSDQIEDFISGTDKIDISAVLDGMGVDSSNFHDFIVLTNHGYYTTVESNISNDEELFIKVITDNGLSQDDFILNPPDVM